MSDFRKAFVRGVQGGVEYEGAARAADWVDGIEEAVLTAESNMRAVAAQYRHVDPSYLKGWLAESWHEGTFNIDAARRQVSEQATRLASNVNGSPDIGVQSPSGERVFQVKFYRSEDASAKALSAPEYGAQGKVAPSDQLDGIRASSDRLAHRNELGRPDQSEQYAHTRENVSDVVYGDTASSQGLTHDAARRMAAEVERGDFDPARHGLRLEDQVTWGNVAGQAMEAGAVAMVVGGAAQALPYIGRALKQVVLDGSVDAEGLRTGAWAFAKGAGQSAVRGALASGIVAAGKAGLLGEAMKSASPPVVGAVVAVAVNAALDAAALRRGEISPEEFGRRMTTNSIVAAASTAGAAVGQVLIPIPYIGAIIGSTVGSAVGAATAGGMSITLDRLSNVELAAANVELMHATLDLAYSLQVASVRTVAVQRAQARLVQTLVASRERWQVQVSAANADLDRATELGSRASTLGREQDRALLAMLSDND